MKLFEYQLDNSGCCQQALHDEMKKQKAFQTKQNDLS